MQALEDAPVEDDEAELELQMALARSRKMKMKKEPDEISAPEMVCYLSIKCLQKSFVISFCLAERIVDIQQVFFHRVFPSNVL